MSSREFLDRHATVNHDDVCLSYVFTGKSFGGDGSVGLAWTASTTGAGWARISGRELRVSLISNIRRSRGNLRAVPGAGERKQEPEHGLRLL